MITISTKKEYQDFLDFVGDPDVRILDTKTNSEGILYKFNTDEEIFVPNKLIITNKYDNELIFGKDKTKNIVSIEVDDDILYIYREDENGVTQEIRKNEFWIVSPKMYSNTFHKLNGFGYYRYIQTFSTRTEFEYARKIGFQRNYFSIYDATEAALVRDGYTYYKGMKVENVSVLGFDIEASGLVMNSNSKVFCISNVYKKGSVSKEKFFSVDDYNNDEIAMIEDWCEWVRGINPSVICGHNVFGYDFQYLNYCYSRVTGQNLPLGRDGSNIQFNTKPSKKRKDGSQEYEYYNIKIHGREIVDTMFLSFDYDFKREFPSYALKSIIDHLDLEKEGRQHYDASKIVQNWDNPFEREKIKRYAKDDAWDAIALYELMIPSFFYYSQSIPKSFQQVINGATGSQLNSMLIRSYLQNGKSLPKASPIKKIKGAISMGIPGLHKNVRKVDVASLYPSIIRQYKIYNKQKDPDGYFLEIANYFTDERLFNKEKAKSTGNKYYQDLEQSEKIAINSLYGLLNAKGLLFNSPDDGEMVTRKGREILTQGVEWATGYTLKQEIKKIKNKGKINEEIQYHWILGDKVSSGRGYQLVNTDTDSFSYTNGKAPTTDEFKKEIQELNKIYPELINWEDDGIFDKFLVIKTKNYVMEQNGNLKYKGSSIKDQKKEPILREFMNNIIDSFLNEKTNQVEIYNDYCKKALNIDDINNWLVKKTVTDKILKATEKNGDRQNELGPLRAIQDAIQQNIIEKVQEGDKIWLYVAMDKPKQKLIKGIPQFYKKTGEPIMEESNKLRFPELWNDDHDAWHYVKRVYDTLDIFQNLLDMLQFIKYFNVTQRNKLETL